MLGFSLALAFLVFSTVNSGFVKSSEVLYDLILRGGRIVDGTGNPWYYADLAIVDGTIADIATEIEVGAKRELDVSGQVVAPGFIDLHTHARRGIFQVPTAENYIRQGVTTVSYTHLTLPTKA